jgi:phage-related protein
MRERELALSLAYPPIYGAISHLPIRPFIIQRLLWRLKNIPHLVYLMCEVMGAVGKPIIWVGASLDDLKQFPEDVKDEIGYALYLAQIGKKHPNAKPLKGFSGVMEIVSDHEGDTYRAVYAVKLGDKIYVLHAFKKKSKRGIKTPKQEIDLIKARLKRAQALAKESEA